MSCSAAVERLRGGTHIDNEVADVFRVGRAGPVVRGVDYDGGLHIVPEHVRTVV